MFSTLIFQINVWYINIIMDVKYEQLIKHVLDKENLSHLYSRTSTRRAAKLLSKLGFQNPLENSSWSNLIDGALKGLEVVALATFDWKLTGIVKLLQSWLKDKRAEMAANKQTQEWGANYDLTNPAGTGNNSPVYTPPTYY